MKKFKFYGHIAVCSLVWQCLVFFCLAAYAEDYTGETIDCTDVSIDFMDDLSLTSEERIRLMDEAFFKSLNRFELCEAAKKMAASSGRTGIDGNGEKGGSGTFEEDSSGSALEESVAGSAMSGTDVPRKEVTAGEDEPRMSGDSESSSDKNEPGKNTGGNKKLSNGKLPEDIPSARNDDTLAAQIRYAAENETDPVKSRQLWNEYRKYKGLPIK